jgi:hypothetical protein
LTRKLAFAHVRCFIGAWGSVHFEPSVSISNTHAKRTRGLDRTGGNGRAAY